jgi:hypothetical protein
MKNIVFLIALSTLSFNLVFSQNVEKIFNPKTYVVPDSITIADGTKISKEEFNLLMDSIINNAMMTLSNDDKKLLEGVKVGVSIPKEEEVVEPENFERPKNPILI